MIYLIFILSVIATFFFVRLKDSWKREDPKSFRYFFVEKTVEFLVPLTVVTFFYAILAWFVNGSGDHTTLARLETLASLLDRISKVVSFLKLSSLTSVFVIVGLTLLDFALLLLHRRQSAIQRYKQYQRWRKRVYTFAVLLCSFTFFGNQVGEAQANIRVRTDNIQRGYARIRQEAVDSLTAAVQQQLYDKVVITFPSDVAQNINDPDFVDTKISALRESYELAREQGLTDDKAEEILNRYDARPKRSTRFDDRARVRVMRGGSWGKRIPQISSSALRFSGAPPSRDLDVGFRVAFRAD